MENRLDYGREVKFNANNVRPACAVVPRGTHITGDGVTLRNRAYSHPIREKKEKKNRQIAISDWSGAQFELGCELWSGTLPV